LISYKRATDFSMATPFQVLITNREVFFSNFIFYWGLCHPVLSNVIYMVKKVAALKLPKNLSKSGIIGTHCKYLNCQLASEGFITDITNNSNQEDSCLLTIISKHVIYLSRMLSN